MPSSPRRIEASRLAFKALSAEVGLAISLRKEYDFADAARGPVLKQPGKTRISIMLDRDALAAFRARAADSGRGYQTAINQALREFLAADELEDRLRRVVREELRKAG